jgi:HPt (histidine-containing phosphotransfer) domain-containing protein
MTPPQAAATRDAVMEPTTSRMPAVPAFDVDQFDELHDMIGEDGVMEMVTIFDAETRQRLRRLAAGGQDAGTLVREMHTLKGAAGSVAAPRLAALGRSLEAAVRNGSVPSRADLMSIEAALEAWLTDVRTWSAHLRQAAEPRTGSPLTRLRS